MGSFLEKAGLDVIWKKLTKHPLAGIKGLDSTLEINSEGNLATTGESPYVECSAADFYTTANGGKLEVGKIYKVTFTGHSDSSSMPYRKNLGIPIVVLVQALGKYEFNGTSCPVESINGSTQYSSVYARYLRCDVTFGRDRLSGVNGCVYISKMVYARYGNHIETSYDFINTYWLRTLEEITDITSSSDMTEKTYKAWIGSPTTVPTDDTEYAFFPTFNYYTAGSSTTTKHPLEGNITIPTDKIFKLSGFSGVATATGRTDVKITCPNVVLWRGSATNSFSGINIHSSQYGMNDNGCGITLSGNMSNVNIDKRYGNKPSWILIPYYYSSKGIGQAANVSISNSHFQIQTPYLIDSIIENVINFNMRGSGMVIAQNSRTVKLLGTFENINISNCKTLCLRDAQPNLDLCSGIQQSTTGFNSSNMNSLISHCGFENCSCDNSGEGEFVFSDHHAGTTYLSLRTTETGTELPLQQYSVIGAKYYEVE